MMHAAKQTVTRAAPRALVAAQTNQISNNYGPESGEAPQERATLTMAQEELKHRIKLPLYDIEPKIENCWIAPNSVVVGEVYMRRWSSVWYNSVVRGDINKVEIQSFASVGDGTVIHTAASLPTGMPANCFIGKNTQIGAKCTLYSCHIEEDVTVGDRCVILEGARLEKGCQIAPGSVVPPGRLIPAK